MDWSNAFTIFVATLLGRFIYDQIKKKWKGNSLHKQQVLFFSHFLTVEEPIEIHCENVILNEKLEELAKWAKKMQDENSDYEIEGSQIQINPPHPPLQNHTIVGAKIKMKKKENLC